MKRHRLPDRALRRFGSLALGVVLAAFAPVAAQAGNDVDRLRTLVDATIRPLMARHDIPGMAVAVTLDGRPHVFNYGVASTESRAPVTDATIFEIGSVSKVFTTTLAAYAQALGKLSLDEHPGRYLARLDGAPIDRATLLELGTYTAGGLPLQFPDDVADDAAALVYFGTWRAGAAPGTVRQYSNPSIGLLGAVTAVAFDEPFATLVETRLLPRFGMRHTGIHLPPAAMADYAWGYRAGRPVRVRPGPMDEATYGIKSTASDMIRLVQANIDPGGLEPPLRRAVEATQVGRFRAGAMVQGLGWEQLPYPLSLERLLSGHSQSIVFEPTPVQRVVATAAAAPRLFNKTGSTGGFGAYVAFVPARRIGIVMLANTSWPIAARVAAAHAILGQLAPSPR